MDDVQANQAAGVPQTNNINVDVGRLLDKTQQKLAQVQSSHTVLETVVDQLVEEKNGFLAKIKELEDKLANSVSVAENTVKETVDEFKQTAPAVVAEEALEDPKPELPQPLGLISGDPAPQQ